MNINDVFSAIESLLLSNQTPGMNVNFSKGADTDSQPGDVIIKSIELMSEDGQRKYNLSDQCKTINIYESLTSPVIFCELGIQDSIGLYQSFPIIGEEYVNMSFKTPGTPNDSTFLFRINSIYDKEVDQNSQSVSYKLQLVSSELIRNSTRYVSKSFKNNISSVVKDIIEDELSTSKRIFVEKTSGIEEGLITRLQPLKAVDYLRRRAVSSKYKSSAFVFFENKNGYHFATIEKLIEDGRKALEQGGSDKQFFFDSHRKQNIADVSMRNIIAYNQVEFGGTIDKAQEGGISNDTTSFDLITGNVERISYKDNSDSFQNLDKDGFPTNTSNFIRKHSRTNASREFVMYSSDLSVTDRVRSRGLRKAFAQNITQNIVRIHIYGDTEITVGDVIQCTLPSGISAENSIDIARLEMGNYLVTRVRHMIVNGDRPQHTIALELIKGNFTENV